MTQQPDNVFPSKFSIPSENNDPAELEIAILRSLGRFEMMTREWIELLHFPLIADGSIRSVGSHRILQSLLKLGLIWRVAADILKRSDRGRTPYVYGLTKDGRDYLEAYGQEPDEETLRRLKWRPKSNPQVGKATLSHDLKAAAWSVGMVQALRRSPRLHQIFVQVEYSTEGQRFDALVLARFWRKAPQKILFTDRIPWWEAADVSAHLVDVIAFALEIDQGTEATRIIKEKAERYRDLSLSGFYQRQIGTFVVPVFLVPDQKRALSIMHMWNSAWKGVSETERQRYSALISTTNGATAQPEGHQSWGPLWGNYIHIASNKKRSLLDGLGCPTVSIWEQQWLK